jgi:para-nitrobenzyl esterase
MKAFLLLLPGALADYTVQLPEGAARGRTVTGPGGRTFGAWEGLPYADPPARWQPPQPGSPWEGTLDCLAPGPACLQYIYDPTNVTLFGQEDCLVLNVYSPEPTEGAGLPVLVFVHGGGLEMGRGDEYRPELLVEQGLVVVTLNYRLGALGFLSADTAGVSGNQGLRDIQLALAWLQGRVRLFGGDPARVTVAGQSGGAWAVALLLASPRSVGLLAGAVLQSGPVLGPGYTYDTRQVGAEKGRRLAEAVGCPGEPPEELEACLLEVPVEDIVRFKADFSRSSTSMGMVDAFAPDPVLPLPYEELISSGRGPQVPRCLVWCTAP